MGKRWKNCNNVYLFKKNTKIESAQTMSVQFLSLKWTWQLSDFPRAKCTAAATLATAKNRSQSVSAMLARCQKVSEKCKSKRGVILNCFYICETQLGCNFIKQKNPQQFCVPKHYFFAVFKCLLQKSFEDCAYIHIQPYIFVYIIPHRNYN